MNEIEFKGCVPVVPLYQFTCKGCEFYVSLPLCRESQSTLKCIDPDIIWIKKEEEATLI